MKNIVIKSIIVALFTLMSAGCGGGGTTPNDTSIENTDTSTNDEGATNGDGSTNDDVPTSDDVSELNISAVKSAQTLDVEKLINDVEKITQNEYQTQASSLVTDIQIDATPNLSGMFESNTTTVGQAKISSGTEKRTIRDYQCPNGGTLKIDLDLIDRGFGADTYMRGDDSSYIYDKCKTAETEIDGTVSLHVDDFKEFDFSLVGEADPMGKFTSKYNSLKISDTQNELLINGSLVYEADSSYPALEGKPPTSLYKKHSTNGWKFTATDKQTDKVASMEFNGLLEKIEYRHVLSSVNDFTFCKTMDYTITLGDENGVVSTIHIETIKAICGDVVSTTSGLELHPTSGQVNITLDEKSIISIIYLSDGSVKYEFDTDGDGTPEDTQEPVSFTYTDESGFNVVETPYINDSGAIDLKEYALPSTSTEKLYTTYYKSAYSNDEYEDMEGEKITINGKNVTVRTNPNSDIRDEYLFNDKNISLVSYDENDSGEIVRGRDTTLGRLYDIGSKIYDTHVTGENIQNIGNAVIKIRADLKSSCTLDKKLNAFTHSHPNTSSYNGDIIRIKCTTKGTVNITDQSSNETNTLTMNDTFYEYMQKGVGTIAEIDDNCIAEASLFSNETEGCAVNDYNYRFLQ